MILVSISIENVALVMAETRRDENETARAIKKEMKEIFVLSWPVSMTRLIICITRLAVRIYMYIYVCVCVSCLYARENEEENCVLTIRIFLFLSFLAVCV